MKTRFIGLACWLLVSQAAHGQTERLDALLQQLQTQEGTARAATAAELARLTEKISTLDPGFSERASPVLLSMLDDPDLNVRRDALALITRLDLTAFLGAQAAESVVQRLAAAMDVPAELERDPRTLVVRSEATVVLGVLGMPAVPLLIDVLQSGYSKLRYQAAVSLGNIGPPAKQAQIALADALSDSDRKVRNAAEAALVRIDAP